MRRLTRDDSGSVLVEFAMAFPILMTVVIGGLFATWAIYLQVEAGNAAKEGARYATVALPPTYRTHPSVQQVIDRVRETEPDLNLQPGDVTVAYPTCSTNPCTNVLSNTPVVVTVTKHLPGFFNNIFTIKASSAGEGRAE